MMRKWVKSFVCFVGEDDMIREVEDDPKANGNVFFHFVSLHTTHYIH